jgi:hypothetical protein
MFSFGVHYSSRDQCSASSALYQQVKRAIRFGLFRKPGTRFVPGLFLYRQWPFLLSRFSLQSFVSWIR